MIPALLFMLFVGLICGYLVGAVWSSCKAADRFTAALYEEPGAARYTRLVRLAGWIRITENDERFDQPKPMDRLLRDLERSRN